MKCKNELRKGCTALNCLDDSLIVVPLFFSIQSSEVKIHIVKEKEFVGDFKIQILGLCNVKYN